MQLRRVQLYLAPARTPPAWHNAHEGRTRGPGGPRALVVRLGLQVRRNVEADRHRIREQVCEKTVGFLYQKQRELHTANNQEVASPISKSYCDWSDKNHIS